MVALIQKKTKYRIPVSVDSGQYEVRVAAEHMAALGPQLERLKLGTQPVIVSNKTVLKHHGAALRKTLRSVGWSPKTIVVPDTERAKSLAVLGDLLKQLAELQRKGDNLFLVLLGGGVVGDLGGVAAGLYRRGIPYVQLPTTLLAQVDSSVGGKTAVDLPQGKNLVGLIYQPKLVYADTSFLSTLPLRQVRSGLAEVIKCGVIQDKLLFEVLEGHTVSSLQEDPALLSWAISRAIGVKAKIVGQDEFETKGIRSLLNFGHTLGHAIEAAHNYSSAYTHGEAISIGMVAATSMAAEMSLVPSSVLDRLIAVLEQYGLPTQVKAASVQSLLKPMQQDKKWGKGKKRWVLPVRIGKAQLRDDVPDALVRKVIKERLLKR